MKRVIQIISAAILSVAFIGVAAGAQSTPSTTCDGSFTITGTGAASNQQIDCKSGTLIEVLCTNTGAVINYTDQNSQSGNTTVTGNTAGGSAASGNVTNSNSSTVDLTFSCALPVANNPSPAPSTPVTPGSGNAKPAATKPAALPYTATNSTLALVVASLAAAAAVVAGSRLAVAAYRHFGAK